MTLEIKGLAIPIGKKNKNGWGLPPSEAENAINSLKSSVLKICPGEAHACDESQDPYGRIGRVTDAWLEADGVHARGEVTDSVAERKLREGTWDEKNWSTYGKGALDDDKWAHDFHAETMTLVRYPAWDKAQYQIAASNDGIFGLRTCSEFTLTASKEGDPITNEPDSKVKDLEKQIADLTSQRDKLKAENEKLKSDKTKVSAAESEVKAATDKVTEAKSTIESLTAANEKLQTQLKEKTDLVASLEKDKTGMVTLEEAKEIAQKISAASAKKELADYVEGQEKEKLVAGIVEIREALGIKADNEKLKTLSAADLKDRYEEYSALKAAASGPGTDRMKLYASAGKSASHSTVGNFNNGKSWEA